MATEIEEAIRGSDADANRVILSGFWERRDDPRIIGPQGNESHGSPEADGGVRGVQAGHQGVDSGSR